ncbi:hypothetical protein AURDEDRAFT_83288, partial [Auricularia subglabra TFB-10046 SS5]
MTTDRETLLSMGFDAQRIDWAMKATGGAGLQPAMDHILAHEGEPVPDLSGVSSSSAPTRAAQAGDEDDDDADALHALLAKGGSAADAHAAIANQEARSIKCSLCGKVFKNTALANFHAEKSGHDQFEESTEEVKPLTEEEKKQKLEDLRAKLAAKRAAKSTVEAQENKANEQIRRKAGKDAGQIRQELQLKEAEKEAAARKREKVEDAKARAAVKAQIEADKKARAERAAREKAVRDGQLVSESAPVSVAPPTAAAAVSGRDYKETRLQIRMQGGGGPYTTSLPSESTLREVAEFVAGQDYNLDVENITLTQQFPRKVFSKADWTKSLRDLGLTPSAVLIAS